MPAIPELIVTIDPLPCCIMIGGDRPRPVEGSRKHDVHPELPVFVAYALGRLENRDPSIVHQNVDTAVTLHDLSDHAVDGN
jgi:hypothetical protein